MVDGVLEGLVAVREADVVGIEGTTGRAGVGGMGGGNEKAGCSLHHSPTRGDPSLAMCRPDRGGQGSDTLYSFRETMAAHRGKSASVVQMEKPRRFVTAQIRKSTAEPDTPAARHALPTSAADS